MHAHSRRCESRAIRAPAWPYLRGADCALEFTGSPKAAPLDRPLREAGERRRRPGRSFRMPWPPRGLRRAQRGRQRRPDTLTTRSRTVLVVARGRPLPASFTTSASDGELGCGRGRVPSRGSIRATPRGSSVPPGTFWRRSECRPPLCEGGEYVARLPLRSLTADRSRRVHRSPPSPTTFEAVAGRSGAWRREFSSSA